MSLIADQHNDQRLTLHGFILVACAGTWSIGILLSSAQPLPPLLPLGGAGLLGLLTVLLWRKPQGRLLALLALCLCLGIWRYSIIAPENDPQSILHFVSSTPVYVQGMVSDLPQSHARSRSLIIETTGISSTSSGPWEDTHGSIEIQLLGSGTTLEDTYGAHYGDILEIHGKLEPAQSTSSRSILASMAFPGITVRGNNGNPLIAFLYNLRIHLAGVIEQVLPQPAAAVLIGLVLGLSTPALQPLKAAFNTTSTTHLLVTSGLKTTLFAGLITASTRRLSPATRQSLLPAEKRRDWRLLAITTLVVLCIAAYTVLGGAGISAIRAGGMGILVAIAPRLGRRYNIYTALAFMLLVMSAIDPLVFWDVGFQLSYLSTIGIVLFTPYLTYPFRRLEHLPGGRLLVENAAVTLASQIATLPIFAVTFQQISLISPLANILAVPIAEILLPLGLLLCACGLLFVPLAILCGWIAWPVLWCLISAVVWCAQLPAAAIPVTNLDSIASWGYYGLLALAFYLLVRLRWLPTDARLDNSSGHTKQTSHSWRWIRYAMALLIIIVTGLNVISAHSTNDTSVTFLSVGPPGSPPEGQAILVRTPERTTLIDGGPDSISLSQALDNLLPSWQRSLDLVVLTCPRSDHIGGLQDIVERYTIGAVIDGGMLHPDTTYARWQRTIRERNLQYTAVSEGAIIPLGSTAELQVLWPGTRLHKGSNEVRDNALIVQLIAPGLRLLILGAGAQSTYALAGLLAQQDTQAFHANVVQMIGETTKQTPSELASVLNKIAPALLIVTPAAQRKTKAVAATAPVSSLATDTSMHLPGTRVVPTAQSGTIEIVSNAQGWHLYRIDD